MAMRKIYLQWLQVQYLKNGENDIRTKVQKEVFRYLLTHPKKLFSSKPVAYPEAYKKYLNVLTSNVKNDKLYEVTKKRLKNA